MKKIERTELAKSSVAGGVMKAGRPGGFWQSANQNQNVTINIYNQA